MVTCSPCTTPACVLRSGVLNVTSFIYKFSTEWLYLRSDHISRATARVAPTILLPFAAKGPWLLVKGMQAALPAGRKTLDMCSLLCYTVFSSFAREECNSACRFQGKVPWVKTLPFSNRATRYQGLRVTPALVSANELHCCRAIQRW